MNNKIKKLTLRELMNNLTNLKEWNNKTIGEQFIRRVKIFLLQEEIRKIEKQSARYKIDATEYLNCLNEGIFHQVDQIRSLSFPVITDIILSAEADARVIMPNGGSFNTDSHVWDELFRKPVQVVTNNVMSKPHKTSGHEFAPCIIDDRLFISVNIQTNKARLIKEFTKLIEQDFITHEVKKKKPVTATPKIIRENAFIQILDYRIIKNEAAKDIHKEPTNYPEDEVDFVREHTRYRYDKSELETNTVRRAAINSLKLLDKWLSNPAHITKIKESLEHILK
jgi:hypothetical protein